MVGWVRHRRFSPKSHQLRYPIFMMYLDLDELEAIDNRSNLFSLEHFNWLSFRRKDYFFPEHSDLKQAVVKKISDRLGILPESIQRVTMLTNLRTLGFNINPVTFYYAFDNSDRLLAIMPEITNTPWNERHQYVLSTDSNSENSSLVSQVKNRFRYQLDKAFHISPFHPMNTQYDWRFSDPATHKNLIHLENWQLNEKVFDATMVLQPTEINARNIRKTLIRFPWMTVKVLSGIYTNALKLWLKGVPFYAHPNKSKKEKTL